MWWGCQPYGPAAVTDRKYSWYSFLLEAQSTPGPQCGRKNDVNKNPLWLHRTSNPRPSQPQGHSAAGRIMSIKTIYGHIGHRPRDLPACSTVPRTTAPLSDMISRFIIRIVHKIFQVCTVNAIKYDLLRFISNDDSPNQTQNTYTHVLKLQRSCCTTTVVQCGLHVTEHNKVLYAVH